MREYQIPSSLPSTEITLFEYPSLQESNVAIFILKGLYGIHKPFGDSWDNDLITLLQKDFNVFLVKTGCFEKEIDRVEQFKGKTFSQESADLLIGFRFVKEHIIGENTHLYTVALSFGGTLLLGTPEMLKRMETVVFIGSGCGKNPETQKPILSTLPEREVLLSTIQDFQGNFIFLHGGKDTVVPRDSQWEIFEKAKKARIRAWVEYKDLDHELSSEENSHTAVLANAHLRNFLIN